MEIKLIIVLDLSEQEALQAALVTHGAPESLIALALSGACRLNDLEEARKLRRWLGDARARGDTNDELLNHLERELIRFGF